MLCLLDDYGEGSNADNNDVYDDEDDNNGDDVGLL